MNWLLSTLKRALYEGNEREKKKKSPNRRQFWCFMSNYFILFYCLYIYILWLHWLVWNWKIQDQFFSFFFGKKLICMWLHVHQELVLHFHTYMPAFSRYIKRQAQRNWKREKETTPFSRYSRILMIWNCNCGNGKKNKKNLNKDTTHAVVVLKINRWKVIVVKERSSNITPQTIQIFLILRP